MLVSVEQMMTHNRQREDLVNLRVALPKSIRRAAQQVNAQPLTSFSELTDDVTTNLQLHSAFQEEVDQAIRRRIANDPDYSPHRFLNTSKFFDSKKQQDIKFCRCIRSFRFCTALFLDKVGLKKEFCLNPCYAKLQCIKLLNGKF